MKNVSQGQLVRLTATFKDIDGALVDPTTVTAKIYTVGSGAVTTSTYGEPGSDLLRDSVGVYYIDVDTTDLSGVYNWRFISTGTGQSANQGSFYVTPDVTLEAAPVDPPDLTLREELAASGGSALVGYLQAGASAVLRTVQARLREKVSVKDFGADSSGVGDNTAILQAAIAAFPSGTLSFPAGTYLMSSNVTFPLGLSLAFDDGAILSLGAAAVATINGPIVAAAHRIFSGTGTVSFGSNRIQKEMWVEWWGAKGDNSTDCTSAINAALTAIPNGSTMRFASARQYLVTTVMLLDHKFQVTLLGNASGIGYSDPRTKPEIVYNGGASGVAAVLKMNNCYACTVDGLAVASNDGVDATKGAVRGIWITQVSGGSPGLSSRNKIVNCSVFAATTQASWIGIDISDSVFSNNEHHVIDENLIVGGNVALTEASQVGISLGHSQVKAVRIDRNNISAVGLAVSVQGSIRARDNTINSVYTVWSMGYLIDASYVIGDDVETIHNYINTNQHPASSTATFIGNRVNNIAATGDSAGEFWIKTVGKFTFIDCTFLNDSFFNVRAPGVYTFLGDSTTSQTYMEGVVIQNDQFPITEGIYGLESMNTTLVMGSRVQRYGGTGTYDTGTSTLQATPTDYIARKTINVSGASSPFSAMYVGDEDITIGGLYQTYGLSIVTAGTSGSTPYRFAVVGVDALGRRAYTSMGAGPADNNLYVEIATANATLSGSNYLTLRWPSQPARPPTTWSIYQINPSNQYEWRLVVSGLANSAGVRYQTYNLTANPGGGYVSRPRMNETSDVGIPGRFLQATVNTFTDADATPSVSIGNRFVVSNTGATNVTNFDDGSEGQIIYLRFTNANTTLKQGASLKNRSGADTTAAADTVRAYQFSSNVWYEF